MKPLTRFFILLFACTGFYSAKAQINYTDIADITLNTNGAFYLLDLNNDGVADYRITYDIRFPGSCSDIAQLNYFIKITPLGTSYVGAPVLSPSWPYALNANSTIDTSLTWKNKPNQLLFSMTWVCTNNYWTGTASGNWVNTVNKFLPLKLVIGEDKYYGWVSIDVSGLNSSFGSIIIKDYAINTLPGIPIRAGEIQCLAPVVTIAAGGLLSFCIGDSVLLQANTNAYNFQWKRNGLKIYGATDSIYYAKTAGTYKVKVSNSCGKAVSGNLVVYNPCRDEYNGDVKDSGILISQDNNAGHLKILFSYNNPYSVQLLDINSKVIYHQVCSTIDSDIDISTLNNGVYILRCSNSQQILTHKFIIVR